MPLDRAHLLRNIRLRPGNLERRIEQARRLTLLHRDINRAMRIKITEPVFFFGELRRPGDLMDVEVGPHRSEIIPGGLKLIPQFVEMPEEIKQVLQQAANSAPQQVANNAPAMPGPTTVNAPAAALKPVVAPKANPLAARIRALATRRAKFNDLAASILTGAESDMTQVEANGPTVLKRAAAASNDELTAITDLGTALKELDATNGVPLDN